MCVTKIRHIDRFAVNNSPPSHDFSSQRSGVRALVSSKRSGPPKNIAYVERDVDIYCLNGPAAADIQSGKRLWQWDGTNVARIDATVPQLMVGSSSALFANYAPYGLYKYDGTTWSRISANTASTTSYLKPSSSR